MKRLKTALTLFLVLGMLAANIPVFAVNQSEDQITVTFTPVTATDLTTLSGEAKILVSVSGAEGDVSIAQLAMTFTGDLEYKSIQFLQGTNNPPECFQYSPNAALVNREKELMPSIICGTPISFTQNTDLFILTFEKKEGAEGDSVTLTLDTENSYCTVEGVDRNAADTTPITVTAATVANEGKTATVNLSMTAVPDFSGQNENMLRGSGVSLTITGETNKGYTYHTTLKNDLVSDGGHRLNQPAAAFTVTETVLASDTYTVEVSAIGYLPCKIENVSFDRPLNLTNEDFVPGDVNGDGKVDAADYQLCQKAVNDGTYTEAADFNRDDVVDKYDLQIYGTAFAAVPDKVTGVKATGGTNTFTVTWEAPADNGAAISGYEVRYGTSATDLSKTQSVSKTTLSLNKIPDKTTYYFAVAAINDKGIGAFSDPVSATTTAGNGGGGGDGGGGGGGGDTPITPVIPVTPVTPTPDEPFTDMEQHAWAKESVYTLKDRGIISGTSETTYSPAASIKRGDFILILTRMLGISGAATENFADVPVESYYFSAISAAKAAGIAQGSDNHFRPDEAISRQDLITLAYRAFLNAGYIAETTELTSLDAFADKDLIAEYAKTAMASMVSAGIIKGADGNVNPLGNATRAEVAVMCARMLNFMN